MEKAIRTFKNHFLSGLVTCDPGYPIHEWDRLLPQCEMTLNLLRNSRFNPRLSSWACLQGSHDFNKVPLCPPGTKILVHNRGSWEYHVTKGWYISPAFEHYRRLKCYMPTTRTEIISDTVRLILEHIPIPEIDINDYLRASIHELIYLLRHKGKTIPGTKSTVAKTALIKLAQLLNRDAANLPNNFAIKPDDCTYSEGAILGDTKSPIIRTSEGGKTHTSKDIPTQ